MAVKIRMKRFGSKNRPQWRIVVSDAKMPRDGRFIEEIGYYDALPKEDIFVVKQDRLDYWVKQGAQMSVALKSLVRREKRKTKKKQEEQGWTQMNADKRGQERTAGTRLG